MSAEGMIAVADNAGEHRYEVRIGGELAGFAQYRLRPGPIAFIHTEVEGRFEGQGLGGKLIAFALDDVRERGLAVLPICPFVTRLHRASLASTWSWCRRARRAEFDL